MTAKNYLHEMQSVYRAFAVVMFAMATGVVHSQPNPSAPLPPAAQEALNKGIIAAKVPDYPLAIRFFETARKSAPQSAVVFLNLGLAESRIPGRELRAMAWFGAYLAANPTASNAPAVKEQIDALDVKSQSNISRLIKSVQEAAIQITGVEERFVLLHTATLWRDSGDMAAALKVAGLIKHAQFKAMALDRIASAQAGDGDFGGAQKTADLIGISRFKSGALVSIAQAKIDAGDLTSARSTLVAAQTSAALIDKEPGDGIRENWYVKSEVQSLIATTQAAAGDVAGAQATIAVLRDAAHQSFSLTDIAQVQIKAGDIEAAKKSLVSAQSAASRIENASYKGIAQEGINKAQAAIANLSNAGRGSGPQPLTLPILGVADWLKKLDDNDSKNDCPLDTEPFLDLAGHLGLLAKSDNGFAGLMDAAKKIVSARNIIAGMLKQQARK